MHIINYLLILVFLVGAGLWLYRLLTKPTPDSISADELISVEKISIESLVDVSNRTINGYLKQDLQEKNLTKNQLDEKNAAKSRLRDSIKKAAYGNADAKRVIKEYIKYSITTNPKVQVNKNNIDDIIPFKNENELRAQDKFFILFQIYEKKYGKDGLDKMFKENNLAKMLDINDDIINEVYAKQLRDGNINLTYADKLDYITQRVFEKKQGFGVADVLIGTTVDEIDAGVSGIPKEGFELKNREVKKLSYSYECIWILLHGLNIRLSCLSFGSQEELIRVCHNVYKYNTQKVFSKKAGYVVSSMQDGSRVVVTRPPFSDKYAFYVRKFDSAPSISPESLIVDEGAQIPILMSKWLIKGQRNIAITGSQGTGKTTMIKSFINFIENFNIRTQELAFEMHLSYAFPDKNISSFQETESITAQEGLNAQKKTNGAVNIVGEVATAEQASHIIQTAMVASLFAMFTHHAKTAYSLVNAIALNLLQLGLYKEKKDAVEMASQILNIDIHLTNVDGKRYIERITEIIPVTDQLYPSEKMGEKDNLSEESLRMDIRHYFKCITDRKLFEVSNIVEYQNGHFVLVNMPSATMMNEIREKLTVEERIEFDSDMIKIQNISDEIKEKYKAA